MAKPIQYIQQYVPVDMGLAQNILGMARQDMKERNQAFDQAAAFENSAIGQAYGVESWDTEYRNKVVQGIQSKIDEALKKRGGDYALAGNDIAKIVMTERSNPFWNDNAKQMEAIKQYRELSRDADNEILGDPRVSYEDVMRARAEGRDPFKVSAIKRSEVYTKSRDYFSNFAKTLRNGDGTWKGALFSEDPYTNKVMNQYFEKTLQYGFKDEKAVEEFLKTGPGKEAVKSLISAYPELEGASKGRIEEVIKQGALAGIGKAEPERVTNQGFARRPVATKATSTLTPTLYPGLTIQSKQDEINTNMGILEEALDGDTFNDAKVKEANKGVISEGMNKGKKLGYGIIDAGMDLSAKGTRALVGVLGGDTKDLTGNSTLFENPEEIEPSRVEKYKEVKKAYTEKYSDIFAKARKEGIKLGVDKDGNDIIQRGDRAAVNWIKRKEIGDAVLAGTDIGFDDYDFISDVINKVPESRAANGDPNTLIPVENFDKDGERAKGISIASLGKLKANTNTRMRPDGNIVLQLDIKGDGKETKDYILNPKVLGSNVGNSMRNINGVQKALNKYNYTDDEIDQINTTPIIVGDKAYVVKIDPRDHLNKQIWQIGQDQSGKIVKLRDDVTLTELKYENFLNQKGEFNKGKDKKARTETYSELDEE